MTAYTLSAPSPANAATAPCDNGASSTTTVSSARIDPIVEWSRCPGDASPARNVRMSNAGREAIRRPSTVIASNVASSAQCTSSSTSTVGEGGSSTSSISNVWMSWGAAPSESAVQRARDTAGQVSDRAQWPRNRKIVAGAEQHPRRRAQVGKELPHEPRLADPRFPGDQDDPTLPACCSLSRRVERGQRPISLEQLHGPRLRRGPESAFSHSAAASAGVARSAAEMSEEGSRTRPRGRAGRLVADCCARSPGQRC